MQDVDIEQMYKEAILELNRNPLNKKVLPYFSFELFSSNPSCGDECTIQVQLDRDGNIGDIGHQSKGCAISQAAISLITEEVKNQNIQDVKKITKEKMLELLGIPITHTRLKCALLGWSILQKFPE